ncbi:MAG TPA: DUF2752 domain-containing protein [Blastocatellia bacterium]|nr:DUF2752 domain-containing protein [Blastocatellia bacterium]
MSEERLSAALALGRFKERRIALALLAGLTAFFIASALFTPSEVRPDGEYFTICSLKRLTGLPCPGCGLTHSFCALGRGRLAEGFAFNLLGPPLYLCAMLLWLRSAFFLLRWKGPVAFFDGLAERIQPIKLFLIAFLLFGAGRILFLLIDRPSLLTESALYRALAGAGG